jgi:poly(3-hydroxybutyrate) depolymerase
MNDVNVNFTGDRSVGGIRTDISFGRSVALWVDNNQGPGSQADTTLVNGLNGNVWIITYNDNSPDMEVRAIAIQNKGHGWPSLQDFGFDGTNAMVDFLMRFSK